MIQAPRPRQRVIGLKMKVPCLMMTKLSTPCPVDCGNRRSLLEEENYIHYGRIPQRVLRRCKTTKKHPVAYSPLLLKLLWLSYPHDALHLFFFSTCFTNPLFLVKTEQGKSCLRLSSSNKAARHVRYAKRARVRPYTPPPCAIPMSRCEACTCGDGCARLSTFIIPLTLLCTNPEPTLKYQTFNLTSSWFALVRFVMNLSSCRSYLLARREGFMFPSLYPQGQVAQSRSYRHCQRHSAQLNKFHQLHHLWAG